VWQGTAIFGCHDGWVYCLNAADGALVWKYRAAPLDRRIIACENLESVWPVHGSVLVLPDPNTGRGRVYAIAGRSIFLDGGLRSLVLDAESGVKIAETVMNEIDPATGKNVQFGREWLPILPAGLSDILSYSGGSIFMGIQPLSLNGRREKVYVPPSPDRRLWRKGAKTLEKVTNMRGVHLFSTIGFLDDSEMHRSAWMYGRDSLGGCWQYPLPTFQYPAANIMSVAEKQVYGYGREFYTEGQRPTMHLFAMDKNPDLVNAAELFKGKKVELRHPLCRVGNATQPQRIWSRKIGTHVRALLAARNKDAAKPDLLFAVGTPEVIDEYGAINLINAQQARGLNVEKIYLKQKSMAGEFGAKLMVVSTSDGSVVSETKLDAPAVFDGMSAANGKIFISDTKGRVICLKPTTAKGSVTFDLPRDDNAPSGPRREQRKAPKPAPAKKKRPRGKKPSAKKQASPMFRRMDVNGDKKVTREELLGLWTDVFRRQDRDRDGMLNVTEFGAPRAFKNMDTDRDGKATLSEYTKLYSDQFDGLDKDRNGVLTTDEM